MSGSRGASRDIELTPTADGWRGRFFAMGSPCEVLVEGGPKSATMGLARIAANEAWRIEDKFSRYRTGNIVDRINSAGGSPVSVDDETARLIEFSATLYEQSGGRFDITSGALRRAWTFDGGSRVPDAATVNSILADIGWPRADWRPPVLLLPAGMQIDFGGIGKEYAVDRAVTLLREASDAPALVNFGGDLAVTGAPRQRSAWQVGRETPGNPAAGPAGVVRLSAGALATSGDTRRFVIHDGVRYGHILDPTTGWPVLNAPASVTVAADTCVQAGVYCTFAMLAGEDAESFLSTQGIKHWVYR